ncbi:unnamed protein product [Schistosoma turkestanicum]|nr:unnamed protein product [Schistosoma turkestanicum]
MNAHLGLLGVNSFELVVFTCSVCGVSSTDHAQIKDHITGHLRKHEGDEQSAVMAQRIVLSSCDNDEFHCSSESDYEDDEVQVNISPEKKERSKILLSTDSNDKSCSSLTCGTPSVTSSNLVPSDSNQTTTISLKSHRHVSGKQPRVVWQDWSKLITRSDKKFICLVCRRFIYSGRTEVVFHTVTRHLLSVAYAHVNDELRAFLPEFMRARSCPWSLSTREEWVWTVPDLPIKSLPPKSPTSISNSNESDNHCANTSESYTPIILNDLVPKTEQTDHNASQTVRASSMTTTPAVTATVNNCNNNNSSRIDSNECVSIPTISPCSLTTVSGFLPVPIMSIHPGSTLSFTSPTLEFTSQTLQPSQSIIPISCILTTNPLS